MKTRLELDVTNRYLRAAIERMLADLRQQRDTGLCNRTRDDQIADLREALTR